MRSETLVSAGLRIETETIPHPKAKKEAELYSRIQSLKDEGTSGRFLIPITFFQGGGRDFAILKVSEIA